MFLAGVPMLARDPKRRAHALGGAFDDREGFRHLRAYHRAHAALENAGLLGGHAFDAVAKIIGMIERDRRDDAEQRRFDDIGGIQSPAEPDFEQQYIGRVAREQQQACRGGDFEYRDRVAGIDTLAFLEGRAQFIVVDKLAAAFGRKPKPLVEAHQMRRGIDMHVLARRFQHRAHEGDGGAFAIGAGNMDDRRQPALGMFEPRQAAATSGRATGRSASDAARASASACRRGRSWNDG